MKSVFDKKEDCCGCTACKHICPVKAIAMLPDEEGFLYPSINQELCIDCGECKKVCPFQNGYDVSGNFELPGVFAVKNADENVRMESTSGGMFTAISDYVLSNKGIIYGVTFDEDMNVIHQAARNSVERDLFKGSKYVQSDLKNVFMEIKEHLKSDKKVLFTGTPCQNAGLKAFLGDDDLRNLILCDIVCHGVPSPLIWKEHISHLKKEVNEPILQYKFRDKEMGWRGANISIKFASRHLKNNSLSKTYSNLYFSHRIIRPSCHNCIYTNTKRPSDITIADFWGIENSMPDFDDNKGISLVLTNTVKGEKLFKEIKQNLTYCVSNINNCLQPQLQYPTKPSLDREAFWKDYQLKGYNYMIEKYAGFGIKNKIKRYIAGAIRRMKVRNLNK